ncbi:GCN5-related N-acetyltransferase [Sphingomonas sp. ID0503]|uniref:GCN5-related N-acetyltransferase n=1 Tax=Sphingomonas sp. ID0503 TaxID=3399691 RepID=UPI003AFAE936
MEKHDWASLERSWLELTRKRLPAEAAARDWPVSADHCFQRILLDNACGGCWYDHISGRPAYAAADSALLLRALHLGEAVLDGNGDLIQLNARSLVWRKQRRNAR